MNGKLEKAIQDRIDELSIVADLSDPTVTYKYKYQDLWWKIQKDLYRNVGSMIIEDAKKEVNQ